MGLQVVGATQCAMLRARFGKGSKEWDTWKAAAHGGRGETREKASMCL